MVAAVKNQRKEPDQPVLSIRQKCANCLKGPNLIKTLVVVVCTGIVVQQISVCVSKLIDVPITTYTHFDFNKTIMYPSLTFCREPPYKFNKMLEYGLYAHPRHTSAWLRFNFSIPLDQLWQEITYNHTEFFAQYGLDGLMDNVEIQSKSFFVHGRCHTLVPRTPISQASKSSGYSITLQHSAEDVSTTTSVYPPGYHVYVHYTREPFTEVQVYNGGLVDHVYVNTGETLDVKLTVDEYKKITSDTDPCTTAANYSANTCTTQYVWDVVGNSVGCSGPWMTSDLPHCSNYSSMRRLISTYMNTYDCHNTAVCPRFCQAYLYNAFVTERQKQYVWDAAQLNWAIRTGDEALQSTVYFHFNSMMVPVYEERYNYDWNIFVADLGGSVGFLLGLSVIGLMTIVGKMWFTLITPFFKTSKVQKDAQSVTSNHSISSSTVTAKVDNLYKDHERNTSNTKRLNNEEFAKKYNDWQLKNLRDP